MTQKTANDFIHTNAEYQKLKGKHDTPKSTPRETPSGQGPGRRGYDKEIFGEWTREELLAHARTLNIDVPEDADRDTLTAALDRHDVTLQRVP